METPDKWVVVKLTAKSSTEPIYKVFATWYGGYLDGDSWKMNSGIKSVVEDKDNYLFHGYSGSVYVCHKGSNCYGTNSYSNSILNNTITRINEADIGTLEILENDTDWTNLLEK